MNTTLSNAAHQTSAGFSIKELIDIISKFREQQSCALRSAMIAKGFDPEKGAVLYLPVSMRTDLLLVPSFVRFHSLVQQPLMCYEMDLRWPK